MILRLSIHLVILILSASSFDPEEQMTVPQIIQRWGYPVESHEVTTDDGYVLNIFRIAHGVNSSNSGCKRPPIVMDHSLLCDSAEFVVNPPQSSPGMILADAGFDVFLMNHRGTTYCRKHRDFNTSDSRFWKFTMDEYAKYDNPAVIDHVLNVTGETSLYWLGHSQGALLGFMMLSERPEYNRKPHFPIRALFQITPGTTEHNARGVWRLIFTGDLMFKPLTYLYRNAVGSHELGLGNRTVPQMIMQTFCATPYFNEVFCKSAFHLVLGAHATTFNFNSIRNKIEHFDHNPEENLARYGQLTAPAYNFSRVQVPVHIFWSSSDWLVTRRDLFENLLPLLRKEVVKGVYEVSDYNHLDFVWATDNAEKVFNRVISIVREQEKQITMGILNFIDILLGSVGISANAVLIVAILLTKDNNLKAYSVILFNSALTDLVAVIVEMMSMTRMIADYPSLVHVYEGFCTHISTFACQMSMLLELHLMFHSILLIAVAFWYRNTVLGGRFLTMVNVQAVILVTLVPSIISIALFTWSDNGARILQQFYPEINMTAIVYSSCNLDDPSMSFVGFWTMTSPLFAYGFIFHFRNEVLRKLKDHATTMSERTREMHGSLIRALTYHSMLPSLSVLGVFSFAAQNLGYQSALIERVAFMSCSVPPAINSLLTLYFVAPYKRFVERNILRKSRSVSVTTTVVPSKLSV